MQRSQILNLIQEKVFQDKATEEAMPEVMKVDIVKGVGLQDMEGKATMKEEMKDKKWAITNDEELKFSCDIFYNI